MCAKASGVIGEGSDSFLIVEEFEATKRAIRCAVYCKLSKLTQASKDCFVLYRFVLSYKGKSAFWPSIKSLNFSVFNFYSKNIEKVSA